MIIIFSHAKDTSVKVPKCTKVTHRNFIEFGWITQTMDEHNLIQMTLLLVILDQVDKRISHATWDDK